MSKKLALLHIQQNTEFSAIKISKIVHLLVWAGAILVAMSINQNLSAQNAPSTPETNSASGQTVATHQGQGQSSTVQQPSIPVLDATKVLVDMEKTLTDAAKNHENFLENQVQEHQKMLEWCYALTAGILCIIVGIGTAAVAFFHFKSRKEIESVVNQRIQATAGAEIQKATQLIADMKRDAERELTNFKALLTPVSAEIADVQRTIKEISALQETLQISLERNTKIVTTLSRTWSVLGLPEPPDNDQKERELARIAARRRDALKQLSLIAEWLPTNRHIAIFRGRLYYCLSDFDSAIGVLDETLAKRAKKNLDKDEDQADLLFNKACYTTRKAKLQTNPILKENLFKEAWQIITASIRLKPENLEEARLDSDFDGILNETRRWEILAVAP